MKDAFVALGMGGPDSVSAIKPFLYNLFCDRDIIDFRIGDFPQKCVARIISSSRSKKIAPHYLKMGMGGASPQTVYTASLLEKLKPAYYERTGTELETFGAMCYYHPFIGETAEKLKKEKYGNLIFFPLFPHYSTTTTGACYGKLKKAMDVFGAGAERVSVITHWYNDKNYCECLVRRINAAAAALDRPVSECHVLFSAHSVPERVIKKGDPYADQIRAHAELLASMAGAVNWEIAYQSKVGPVKWLEPSTSDCLHKLRILKTDNIIVVPISFISDHIETLIELDEQLMPVLSDHGVKVVRSAGLNDDDDFVNAVADMASGCIRG